MGKYSNVNVSALSSAVNQALSELSSHGVMDISSSILNSRVLQSSVNANLSTAFSTITSSVAVTGSIANLRKKLENLIKADVFIKIYQEIVKDLDRFERLERSSRNNRFGSASSAKNSIKSLLANYESTIDGYLRG